MDLLPTDQQEALRKTNTERLRQMAAKTGDVEDDELETMDRMALLEVVAKDVVSRRGAAGRLKSEKSDRLREMELQLELKRMELEAEGKQREAELERRRTEVQAEAENKRLEAEAENRRREAETELESKRIDAENRALELQNKREKREHELRLAEAGRPAEGVEREDYGGESGDKQGRPRVDPRRPRVETLADRVKRYGSALKQVVSPMPTNATEIPQFFESLEAMFRTFEVPADLCAKLLLPFSSVKAKSLISRLRAEELEDCEGVRDFILSEFKLTPREYKARFDNATKRPDETFIYFAARLRNNL